jgi:TonB family protein
MKAANAICILSSALIGMIAAAPTHADTGPAPTGAPHSCNQYPAAELASHIEGTSTLRFRIGTDGEPKEIAIAKSSGNANLDQAAIACVTGWKYAPATKSGKPVETAWKADVVWKINELPPHGAIHRCDGVFPAERGSTLGATIQFVVGANGHVKNPAVIASSGQPGFDAALAHCVSAWVYAPATRNDVPIEANWAASFDWSPLSGLRTTDGYTSAHTCGLDKGGVLPAEGTTVLSFVISKKGSVEDVAVRQSSGNKTLDEMSKWCVGHWTYNPALRDGRPVAIPWGAQVQWSTSGQRVIETGDTTRSVQ